MVLFANATLSIERINPTPDANGSYNLLTIATIDARVEPYKEDYEMQAGENAVDFDNLVIVELGTDIRMNDHLSGWNPRNVTPAPVLIVRRVNDILGPILPHLEVYADNLTSRES